jgi:uncharacterized protein
LALPPPITRRQFLCLSATLGAATLAGFAIDAAEVEPRRPVVERVEVTLPRLPESLNGLTVAQLSDLHYDSPRAGDLIRSAVEITNQLAPDLIVLTGDFVTASPFISKSRAAQDSEPCAKILGDLHAPLGVFGVLGNHDHESDPRVVSRSLEASGVTVLRNFNLRIEKSGVCFWIAGVDDVLGGGANLARTLQGAEGFTVLLAHEPDYADVVAGHPVDLQLSGHSHGGQVRLPLVGSPYLPLLARKYPRGLRQVGPLKLYTNRGIGTIILPIRFNCPPEITLHTLRCRSAPVRAV